MSSPRLITRRRALAEGLAGAVGAGALAGALAGCGRSAATSPAASGSTLLSTWFDPVGDGQLRVGPGEPLLARLELGTRAAPIGTIATLGHVTDAHVLDPSSPARVTFLDRLGLPFQSTFRPQEALTRQVLAGAAAAVRAMRPDLVVQGGDLIDNDQDNELSDALAVLGGGTVGAIGRRDGYRGVQSRSDSDPFYYRPAVDAPQHPQVLRAASRPFTCRGQRGRWCPVLGDHDALVAGELVPTALTRSLAVGDRALWDIPQDVRRPSGVPLTVGPGGSPDGPPQPLLVDQLLRQALAGPTVHVPADLARRELSFGEVIERLRRAAGGRPQAGAATGRLDYVLEVGSRLRIVVLDLVRRDGGSGGQVVAGQSAWLEHQLAAASARWVLVVSHQPLASSENGDAVVAVLDRAAAGGRDARRAYAPQQDRAPPYRGRRVLADHDGLADRLSAAVARPADRRDRRRRRGDPNLDARPRVPRPARDDRPTARVPRRPRRQARAVRGRAARPERHALPESAVVRRVLEHPC